MRKICVERRSGMDAMTSGNIWIDSDFKIKYIVSLKMIIEAQKHGNCILKGVLEEGMEAQQTATATEDLRISIVLNGESREVLFNGIIKETKIYFENTFYYIEITAVTASELLDRKNVQQSFQDETMTYEDVVKRSLEPYGILTVTYADEAKVSLGEPLIQYGETEWEFLLRLGSHLHLPVYADYMTGSRGFYFGMRKGREVNVSCSSYSVGISGKYYEADRRKDNIKRSDYLYYKISSDENYQIGDIIHLSESSYTVFKKCAELVCEKLEYTYWAGRKGNWYIPCIEHEQLTGMEFTGIVVNTQAEKVNIKLRIDEPREDAEYAWSWKPVSGNIMYAMPEKGTAVKLCFGSETAAEGMAHINVRENGKSMPGQQSRTLMAKAGKKIEMYPNHLSFEGGGGQTSITDEEAVSLSSMKKVELTAAGRIILDAADIRAQTPLEINIYKAQAHCEQKGEDIKPKGTKSNPPTGGGDSGFTMNFGFNSHSKESVLCGSEFIRYQPFWDAPGESVEETLNIGELKGNLICGLAASGGISLLAAYGASVFLTGGTSLAVAPWIIGGLAAYSGGASVYGKYKSDYQNGKNGNTWDYILTGVSFSSKGAVAGGSFCVAPYAAETAVSGIVPYGMTGIQTGGMFISSEKMVEAAMATGYTVTASNMLVKLNDATAGVTGKNTMRELLGKENYQTVKETSQTGSDWVLQMGLLNPDLYGTNKNIGNISQNAAYDNGGGGSEIKYTYNMVENPGPLADMRDNPAGNFYGGKYNAIILTEDTVFYRAGKEGTPLGQWFTSTPVKSVAQVRIDLAVKPQWIDLATGELTGTSIVNTNYAIKIPAGTMVYSGPVGYQGGIYLGGEDIIQIFILQPWSIEGVEVIGSAPLY